MVEVPSLFNVSTCEITSAKLGKVHYRLCDNEMRIVGDKLSKRYFPWPVHIEHLLVVVGSVFL